MMMTGDTGVLVTGALGVVGRAVVPVLRSAGHYVVATDLPDTASAAEVHADLADARQADALIGEGAFSAVVHAAAIPARDRHRHLHPAGRPQARQDPPRPQHTPPPPAPTRRGGPPPPRPPPPPPRLPRPAPRRERITAIITSQPPRDWSGHELAVLLHVKPRNMLTQLGEWARLGFFTRTGFGTYKLNTPPESSLSTTPPDP